jgi:4-amino-4-deoxy-L-arabinose transferase-like glycosyltransferase
MTSQPSGDTTATPAQRIGWAILIVVTLSVCYFSHLGVIGFVGPDEPRYAWIARDMAETGDWVTPRLYGKPWFEKPPLLYWGGAIFFKLLGQAHPEVAARLPSAICALLATLALAWLAWRTYGEQSARWLLLLLPTSVGMIGFSHAAATDMPFAGMLTMAMVCAAVVLGLVRNENTPILPYTPWAALLLFGFFLGLAVLAKGPAAIILCGGAVFFWAVFTKRWRHALRLFHPAAIAAFCITALPWYIVCARRNPDFFRVFIIEHNFKRYLTPEFQHIQPFWFYVPVLLVAFLPWTALTLWASSSALASRVRRHEISPITVLLLTWSVFCFVFFSISKSKLPGYVLPAVPALGLLLVRARQKFTRRFKTFLWVILAFAGAGLVVLSLVATYVGTEMSHHARYNGHFGIAAGILIFVLALPNFLLLFGGRTESTHADRLVVSFLVSLPILIAVLFVNKLIPSLVPLDPSGKTLSSELYAAQVPTERLAVGPMNRDTHFSLNFYLRDEIPDWDKNNPKTGSLVLPGSNCPALVVAPFYCEESPIFLKQSRRYVFKVGKLDSLDGLSGGREPKQKE